jgi:regulator of protease activity HflC (stomatin/prohibitin superfamily)
MEWLAWLTNLIKQVGDLVPLRLKVPPTHRVVKFRNMTEAIVLREGTYWYWPWMTSVVDIPVKRQVVPLTTQDVVTKDGKPVQAKAIVAYTVGDSDEEVILAAVEAYNVDVSLDDEATAVLCSLLTSKTFDDIQLDRAAFNKLFTARTRTRLREYGLQVKRAQLTSFVTGEPLLHFLSTPLCVVSPSTAS